MFIFKWSTMITTIIIIMCAAATNNYISFVRNIISIIHTISYYSTCHPSPAMTTTKTVTITNCNLLIITTSDVKTVNDYCWVQLNHHHWHHNILPYVSIWLGTKTWQNKGFLKLTVQLFFCYRIFIKSKIQTICFRNLDRKLPEKQNSRAFRNTMKKSIKK